MFRRHKLIQHIGFWSVIVLAATAEGWMDLLSRAVFRA